MRVAPEGRPFILGAWLLLGAFAALSWWLAAAAWLPIALWVVAFFRDPTREGPRGDRLVIVCKMIRVRPGAIIVCRFQAFVRQSIVADGKIKGIPLPVDALTAK